MSAWIYTKVLHQIGAKSKIFGNPPPSEGIVMCNNLFGEWVHAYDLLQFGKLPYHTPPYIGLVRLHFTLHSSWGRAQRTGYSIKLPAVRVRSLCLRREVRATMRTQIS